jgi:hypothetical protein
VESLLLFFDILTDQFVFLSESLVHHIHDALLGLLQLLTDPVTDLPVKCV